MGLKRVITYWLLLALLAHLLRGINSVVPPVQSSMPVVETFPLDYALIYVHFVYSHVFYLVHSMVGGVYTLLFCQFL